MLLKAPTGADVWRLAARYSGVGVSPDLYAWLSTDTFALHLSTSSPSLNSIAHLAVLTLPGSWGLQADTSEIPTVASTWTKET